MPNQKLQFLLVFYRHKVVGMYKKLRIKRTIINQVLNIILSNGMSINDGLIESVRKYFSQYIQPK